MEVISEVFLSFVVVGGFLALLCGVYELVLWLASVWYRHPGWMIAAFVASIALWQPSGPVWLSTLSIPLLMIVVISGILSVIVGFGNDVRQQFGQPKPHQHGSEGWHSHPYNPEVPHIHPQGMNGPWVETRRRTMIWRSPERH